MVLIKILPILFCFSDSFSFSIFTLLYGLFVLIFSLSKLNKSSCCDDDEDVVLLCCLNRLLLIFVVLLLLVWILLLLKFDAVSFDVKGRFLIFTLLLLLLLLFDSTWRKLPSLWNESLKSLVGLANCSFNFKLDIDGESGELFELPGRENKSLLFIDGLVSLFVLSLFKVAEFVCRTVDLPLLLVWVFNLFTVAVDDKLELRDRVSFEWPFNDPFNWLGKGGELLLFSVVVLVELILLLFINLK